MSARIKEERLSTEEGYPHEQVQSVKLEMPSPSLEESVNEVDAENTLNESDGGLQIVLNPLPVQQTPSKFETLMEERRKWPQVDFKLFIYKIRSLIKISVFYINK
jgi:hypothetical protein